MKYIRLKEDKSPFSNYNNTTEDLQVMRKWENAGLILTNNIVVVDFDSREDIARDILNKSINKPRAIKTDRGLHLYYKIPKGVTIKNNNKILTVLGCEVDYKTGQGNAKQYIMIKRNGKDREILQNTSLEDLPPIPLELLPIKYKNSVAIVNLSEGSRNENLFKHLGNVKAKYSQYNDIDSLNILAKEINSYLSSPLDLKEIDSIVKSVCKNEVNYINENLQGLYFETKNGTKKLDIFKLTDYIQNKLNVTLFNGNIFFKINNKYVQDRQLLRTYIDKNLNIRLTKKEDLELEHQLTKTNNIIEIGQNLPIVFNNNYAITQQGEIVAHTEDNFTPFFINVAYNKNAYNKNVYDFLMWFMSYDEEMFSYIKRILGHILLYRNFPQFAFFFIGASGKNGKSTFFKMLSETFSGVMSNLSIEEMNKETNVPIMQSKLLNIGDDINNTYIENSSVFKRVVSGDVILSRALYEMSKPLKNCATLLFSCNEMPTFKDKSGGIERRIRGIPCDNTINDNNIDLSLIDKLTTENAKSYILNLAVEGLKEILKNKGQMLDPIKVLEISKEYMNSIDSVRAFIDNISDKDYLEFEPIQVFLKYSNFCDDLLLEPLNRQVFTKRFTKSLNLKTSPKRLYGQLKRVYTKK